MNPGMNPEQPERRTSVRSVMALAKKLDDLASKRRLLESLTEHIAEEELRIEEEQRAKQQHFARIEEAKAFLETHNIHISELSEVIATSRVKRPRNSKKNQAPTPSEDVTTK